MTTRAEWAQGLLAYADWSESQEKIIGLVAQASREDTGALNNPLATTEPAPGASDYNSAGVRNYPSLDAGYAATLATLRNGYYPQLLGILSDPSGGSAAAYATSHDLTVWGTGNCLSEVESIKGGDPNGYMTREIAGGGAVPTSPPSPPAPPAPPVPVQNPEEELMQIYTVENGVGYVVAANLSYKRGIPDGADAAALIATGLYKVMDGQDGRPAPLTPALLNAIPG